MPDVPFAPVLNVPELSYISPRRDRFLRIERRKSMGIRQTFKKWAAYQQTVRELGALDNRQLTDLGITRADIQRIARDHARSL